jgi:hypothetical protein
MSYTTLQERNLAEVGKRRATDSFPPWPRLLPTEGEELLALRQHQRRGGPWESGGGVTPGGGGACGGGGT